jgi:hypothetical protein
MEPQVRKVQLVQAYKEQLDHKELQAHKGHLVSLGLQAQQVVKEQLDHKEHLVLKDLRELKDQLVLMEPQEHREQLVHKVVLVQAYKAYKVLQDQVDLAG